MQCKLFKLINGETVIGCVDKEPVDNVDGYIEIRDPVLVSSVKVPMDNVVVETFMMQTWLKMAKTAIVRVPMRNIVVNADLLERAEEQYKLYLSQVDANRLTETELQNLIDENPYEDDMLDYAEEEEETNDTIGPTLH